MEWYYVTYRTEENCSTTRRKSGKRAELSEAPVLGFDPGPDAPTRYEVTSAPELR